MDVEMEEGEMEVTVEEFLCGDLENKSKITQYTLSSHSSLGSGDCSDSESDWESDWMTDDEELVQNDKWGLAALDLEKEHYDREFHLKKLYEEDAEERLVIDGDDIGCTNNLLDKSNLSLITKTSCVDPVSCTCLGMGAEERAGQGGNR